MSGPNHRSKERVASFRYGNARDLRGGAPPVACGKLRFASRSAAKTKIKAVRGSGRHDDKRGVLGAYHCPECEAWHIGHRPAHLAPRKV